MGEPRVEAVKSCWRGAEQSGAVHGVLCLRRGSQAREGRRGGDRMGRGVGVSGGKLSEIGARRANVTEFYVARCRVCRLVRAPLSVRLVFHTPSSPTFQLLFRFSPSLALPRSADRAQSILRGAARRGLAGWSAEEGESCRHHVMHSR